MTAPAIVADSLAKRYQIGRRINRNPTVRDAISETLARWTRPRKPATTDPSIASRLTAETGEFWALRGVSFEIGQGAVTGVIGRNGAGKSTLLKILSRITRPTGGRAVLRGRVGSLLEVGTGFHPELTGRENIFLNGAILGMPRAEIQRKLDEIIAFSEIGDFVDTPVKHFSSGMYLRLAFAVAAHLEPEILLVDEVLAVGDASFQKKCLGKMGDVARAGRTVLLVSHNLDAILRLCPRSLLIDDGQMAAFDDSKLVVARYLSANGRKPGPDQWIDFATEPHARGSGLAKFTGVRFTSGNAALGGHVYPGGPLRVTTHIDAGLDVAIPSLAVTIRNQTGLMLVNADVITEGIVLPLRAGRNEVVISIDALHLNPGLYLVDLWIGDGVGAAIDWRESAFYLEVVPNAATSLGTTTRIDAVVPCSFSVSSPELVYRHGQ